MNNETAAREMVAKGDLVAMIVIPQGFSETLVKERPRLLLFLLTTSTAT